jgi:hypothetical protein
MLETVREEYPQAVKSALEQIAPSWLELSRNILGQDPAGQVQLDWESISIRIEIFRVGILSLENS